MISVISVYLIIDMNETDGREQLIFPEKNLRCLSWNIARSDVYIGCDTTQDRNLKMKLLFQFSLNGHYDEKCKVDSRTKSIYVFEKNEISNWTGYARHWNSFRRRIDFRMHSFWNYLRVSSHFYSKIPMTTVHKIKILLNHSRFQRKF